MADFSTAPQLDPREQHFRIPRPRQELSPFLRYLPSANAKFQLRRAVLYIHGATFTRATVKRDIRISRATHLLHLATMRLALWQEGADFRSGEDGAPIPS